MSRRSGITIPLFSIRTRTDWGIGEIPDLAVAASWFSTADQRIVQVLPMQELADGETSPYGALSAFAIDPIYIAAPRVPDLDDGVIDSALGREGAETLARLRAAPGVDYVGVRALKRRVLGEAFERFRQRELGTNSERARAMRAFAAREGVWLSDFALYAALRASHGNHGWSTWPARERDREGELLALAREPRDDGGLGTRVLEQMYLQWIAHEQWACARAELRTMGITLMGDMPFVVGWESADVWAHRGQFLSNVSVGAPPDDFAPQGQSWGLPAYDWHAMDKDGLAWLRARARHTAALFDTFRIDHLVGFFRQWVSGEGQPGHFTPSTESEQRARGETVLRALIEASNAGAVIGEDLGVIPPFVRETMARLSVPGYKVLPWERDERFMPREPRAFPKVSVSTWSTHDTLPITAWWDVLEGWERERLAALRGLPLDMPPEQRELALIELLFSSGSDLTLLLAAELIGDRARINTPGTVNAQNWTWRLPRPIEELSRQPELVARFDSIRELSRAAGR